MKTLPVFADPKVASISGHLRSSKAVGTIGRWRSRHLFKEDVKPGPPVPTSMLITYGTLMRKASILEVGNFNSSLVHTGRQRTGAAPARSWIQDTRFAERRGTLHCSTKAMEDIRTLLEVVCWR